MSYVISLLTCVDVISEAVEMGWYEEVEKNKTEKDMSQVVRHQSRSAQFFFYVEEFGLSSVICTDNGAILQSPTSYHSAIYKFVDYQHLSVCQVGSSAFQFAISHCCTTDDSEMATFYYW